MRVLVVDDSVAVRSRIVERLREAGIDVAGVAGTAASAVTLAEALAPDAIVLDIQLPDSSGLTILGALKALVPVPLVVALTIEPRYRDKCLAMGADLFLDKSTQFDDLADALKSKP